MNSLIVLKMQWPNSDTPFQHTATGAFVFQQPQDLIQSLRFVDIALVFLCSLLCITQIWQESEVTLLSAMHRLQRPGNIDRTSNNSIAETLLAGIVHYLAQASRQDAPAERGRSSLCSWLDTRSITSQRFALQKTVSG